jgi:hypothetical protein
MESALISIVTVGLVIVAAVTMMMNSFSSATILSDSWKEMEQQAEDIRRTDIAAMPPDSYTGGNINLLVSNEGQTKLTDFNQWDVIARYETGVIAYINYTDNTSPESNQWTVEGIYQSDNVSVPEVFDTNILNPGETAKLTVNLDPEIAENEYGLITVSAPNGVTSQCMIKNE